MEDQLSCMYNNKYERQTALCLPASQGVLRHWKGDGGGGGGGGEEPTWDDHGGSTLGSPPSFSTVLTDADSGLCVCTASSLAMRLMPFRFFKLSTL